MKTAVTMHATRGGTPSSTISANIASAGETHREVTPDKPSGIAREVQHRPEERVEGRRLRVQVPQAADEIVFEEAPGQELNRARERAGLEADAQREVDQPARQEDRNECDRQSPLSHRAPLVALES